jgi:hypothetical protein
MLLYTPGMRSEYRKWIDVEGTNWKGWLLCGGVFRYGLLPGKQATLSLRGRNSQTIYVPPIEELL